MFIRATHQGRSHAENQDRVLTRKTYDRPLSGVIAVADGITQCSYGGSVANWVVERHLAKDRIFDARGDFESETMRYLDGLRDEFLNEFAGWDDMLSSGAALSLVVIRGTEAHAFWAGDCPIYETSRHSGELQTSQVSRPDVEKTTGFLTDHFGGACPFVVKHARISPGTEIVTVTSDGLVCDEVLLNQAYAEHDFTPQMAEALIQDTMTSSRSDDSSFVAMRMQAAST